MGARGQDGDAASQRRARGRYLVERVAMCGQCHTPRGSDHELRLEQWLEGAVVPVKPPYSDMPWALQAPAIAGLRGMSDHLAPRVLTHLLGPVFYLGVRWGGGPGGGEPPLGVVERVAPERTRAAAPTAPRPRPRTGE